jgi:hypothetical protein
MKITDDSIGCVGFRSSWPGLMIGVVRAFILLSMAPFGCGAELLVQPTFEIGAVGINKVKTGSFTITNTSSETTKVTNLSSSCACTKVSLVGDPSIAPGATREIEVSASFGDHIGDYKAVASIEWENSAGKRDLGKVSVHGVVTSPLVFESNHVDFGKIDQSDDSKTMIIKAFRGNAA